MNGINRLLHDDSLIYLIALYVFSVVMLFMNPVAGIIFLVVSVYMTYLASSYIDKKQRNKEALLSSISAEFDSVTKHAIFNMPFPLVIVDESGKIIWYNTPFMRLTELKEMSEMSIDRIFKDIPQKLGEDQTVHITYRERNYRIHINEVNTEETDAFHERVTVLYFVEETSHVLLESSYEDEKLVMCLVFIDNYDDVKKSTPDVSRPMLLAEADNVIDEYFGRVNAMVRKYENDKYLIVMDKRALMNISEKRFDVLDDIKELKMGNTIPMTLSIGVSNAGCDPRTAFDEARGSVDIALGRGGDQAVVREMKSYRFYGGKSKALEKRNKTKARVFAEALRNLIESSDNVFIMGHTNPDMDAIGAGIGVLRAVKNLGKTGYIVFGGGNSSIDNLMEKMREEQPAMVKDLISGDTALSKIGPESLIILVDNHKPSFTEEPRLLGKGVKTVLIDHHRRGVEFVENPVLVYLEPYASSTCELVTEVLSYISDELNLTQFEAEALMAGICVDTKNFSFQTGRRTFEAASILKGAGADMTAIKQLFRDDPDTLRIKAKVVSQAQIYRDKFAIGLQPEALKNSILIAAQAADELLDILGIEASFVLSFVEEGRIHISGRSLGTISVQLILEELGGGGHLTSAGAQLKDVDIEEAKNLLIAAIEKYMKEGKEQ